MLERLAMMLTRGAADALARVERAVRPKPDAATVARWRAEWGKPRTDKK